MSEPDQFDFSGLASYPPPGLHVLEASDYLMVARRTSARTIYFVIYREGGRFHMHSRSRHMGEFSRALCAPENRVLSNDELQPLLSSLGWGKAPKDKPAGRF